MRLEMCRAGIGAVAALLLFGSLACSAKTADRDVVEGGPSQEANSLETVPPPAHVGQAVKVGDAFVVVNPNWWSDHSRPPLLFTDDLKTWHALPIPTRRASAYGLGIASGRLVVSASGCTEAVSGSDLCSDPHDAGIYGSSAVLRIWTVSDDFTTFNEVELPDGLTIEAESLAGSTAGSKSVFNTARGLLLVGPDGVATIPKFDSGFNPLGTLGFDVVGSKMIVLDSSRQDTEVGGTRPLEDRPSLDVEVKSISWVSLDDPEAPPTTIDIPDRVPGYYPFVTAEFAIWIDDTRDWQLDLTTGKLTSSELPADVRPVASVQTPDGGRMTEVDQDGSVFLTPDPLYMTEPINGGVAKRSPTGQWQIVRDQPVSSTYPLYAANGLYQLGPGAEIIEVAR